MQTQRPEFRQEQKLKLTQKIIQAINIMTLPIQDLRTRIQEEVEKNPALEIIEDNFVVSIDEISKKEPEYSIFEETSDSGFRIKRSTDSEDSKRQFMEGTLTRSESLYDHLMWQLRLQKVSEDWYRIGEILIQNLDDNGFHIEDPESIVKDYEIPILEKVIKIIQTFDPIGVCTKDFKESLLVQVDNFYKPNPNAREIIEKYFKQLEKGKYTEIAKKIKISEDEVKLAADFIKTLDPMPGRNYSTEKPKYVIPDVMVKLKDGEFVIVLNDEEIPVLSVNPFFKEINDNKNKKVEKDLNKFVTEKINDARWFIRSIGQRNETLLKTVRVIVEFQRDFFRNGPKYLVPLVLKDVAKEIDVHEATVSRATKEKYIQTEWGIFELKYFFSNSITGSSSAGSKFSKQAVKEIMKEIIINNTEEKQLSDSKIAEILLTRGIKIARRTVAKYRSELNINSSFLR